MDRYSNNEDALRQEFGIDLVVDGSEAAGGLKDPGRGHARHRIHADQGANMVVLDDVARLPEPVDMLSQVEETDQEEGNAPISIL